MTKYIVAVRCSDGNEIFEFKSEEDRANFLKDIEGQEYATSEIE